MSEKYDAIVIGSGHNGLVAAAYLGKAGKRVLVLEKTPNYGGATKSVAPFPGIDASISRYSYLVALFPDKIKRELDLEFETLSRTVSSFTPWKDSGILINHEFDSQSRNSINDFTADSTAGDNWENFYKRVGELAAKLAPTLLEPLPDENEIRTLLGDDLWSEFISRPLAQTLDKNFADDVIRGIVLTDGLIGTFTSANDLAANICFLYHLIGNGSGEWKVPLGGMGALVAELVSKCQSFGVQLKSHSEVVQVDDQGEWVKVTTLDGKSYTAALALANCAPQVLEKISGIKSAPLRDGSQLKLNLLLSKLPRLKCGVDPKLAFAGTFHIDESYSQLERAFEEASAGELPKVIPCEMYCHTLTDPSILGPELRANGAHTLTLFAIHTPAKLFDLNHDERKAEALRRIFAGLNRYLVDPIESCIAHDANGDLCIEFKTPQELEREIGLPRGNIFHGDLQFPWRTQTQQGKWGVEIPNSRILMAGAGAVRGGGVSGIAGHNAAMAALERLRDSN
jgi:phytoene dehydrogenase-like protein